MERLLELDRQIFLALNGADWPGWWDRIFITLTRDESLLARLSILALFLFLLWISPAWRRRALWLIPLIGLSDWLNSSVLKDLFMRPRPCQEMLEGMRLLVDCGPAYSFPSSHAANMGAVGVFLAMGARKAVARRAILILPILVAYSRVHVGVHYFGDILAGFAEGALLALLWNALLLRLPPRLRLLRPGEKPIRDSETQ